VTKLIEAKKKKYLTSSLHFLLAFHSKHSMNRKRNRTIDEGDEFLEREETISQEQKEAMRDITRCQGREKPKPKGGIEGDGGLFLG